MVLLLNNLCSKKNELSLRILFDILEPLSYYNVQYQTEGLLYDEVALIMEESFIIFAQMIFIPEKANIPFREMLKIVSESPDLSKSSSTELGRF